MYVLCMGNAGRIICAQHNHRLSIAPVFYPTTLGNDNRSTTGTDHAYVECLVKDRVWSITISQVQWHGIDKIVFDPRHTSYCSLYFVYVRCVAIAICCIITQTTSPTSHNPTSHLATQVKHTTYLRSTCVHDRLSITCRRAQV